MLFFWISRAIRRANKNQGESSVGQRPKRKRKDSTSSLSELYKNVATPISTNFVAKKSGAGGGRRRKSSQVSLAPTWSGTGTLLLPADCVKNKHLSGCA